jgi:hypothetical protein
MNAPFIFTLNVSNGIGSTGQINTVHGTAYTAAEEATKAIKLRYTRTVRYSLVKA